MKSKKILLGTLGAVAIASTLMWYPTNSETGIYSSRVVQEKSDAGLISGAFEYYELIRKNVVTGQIEPEDKKRAESEIEAFINSGNRGTVNFKDHGPDNVGGRTRAILVDKNDYKHIYAGSVSGGLFESFNRGNYWQKVEGYDVNFGISSMCQTDDGTIYVATGHSEEEVNGSTQATGMNGNGVYYSNDGGVTFNHIDGTENNTFIDEIAALENAVLIAGSEGLYKYESGSLSNFAPSVSGVCKSLAVSNDFEVIVASFSTQRTYVSTDGGSSFTPVFGNDPDQIPGGKSRVEYAISHEKVDGDYYVYASMSSGGGGTLYGVYLSTDNGMTWTEIAPNNNGAPGAFAPFDAGGQAQGNYDQIMAVVPGDPETCLLGGIAIHGKSVSGNWDTRSSRLVPQTDPLYVHSDQHEMTWDSEGRLWIGNDGGIFYSDDAGHTFREANRGYNVTQFYRIGVSAHGDVAGGSQDNGTQANYHNNHTYQEHDQINGGDGYACDFSFMNRDVVFSTIYFGAIYRTGDRGINTTAITATNIPTACGVPGDLTNPLGSFYTVTELYENPNDVNSKDTVVFAVTKSLGVGDTVEVPSLTSQKFMTHILTEPVTFQDSLYADPALTITDIIITDTTGDDETFNLYDYPGYTFVFGSAPVSVGDSLLINGTVYGVDTLNTQTHYFGTNPGEPGEVVDMGIYDFLENIAWDTVRVIDPYQSWFAFGLGDGCGVWLTRNALRFSALHDGFIQAGGGMVGEVTEMEFSKDGNHLFVGTSAGRLYRLSGIADIYSPNPVLGTANGNYPDTTLTWGNTDIPPYTPDATFDEIANFNGPVTGINVEKGNPDHVVVSLGGYGANGRLQKSNDATSSNPNFSNISGLPAMPCLSILMDRNNPDVIFVGTDFGLYRTENGSSASPTWEYCESPFGKTPVFDLKQNWRTWDEGCYKPGEIYIGTHGRGIWSTDEYLTLPDEQDNIVDVPAVSDLLLYPNPVVDNATIAFNAKADDVANIRVYSLTGRLVMELNNISVNNGYNTIDIDTDDLSNGTYIVSLSTESVSETIKFIKQ